MNIFFVHESPSVSAEQLCDKHIVKMIEESRYMLYLAGLPKQDKYPGYYNHPCSIWVRENRSNYLWLRTHALRIGEVYSSVYNKTHKSHTSILSYAIPSLPKGDITEPPLCMPDVCKTDNPVDSYRNYYRAFKLRFALWKSRPVPEWYYLNPIDLFTFNICNLTEH
jgi:hypothetical protein